MSDELFNIHDMARIYRTTPGSIRTEIWKHRKKGRPLRFPMPIPQSGELRWLKSTIDEHLDRMKQDCAK